MRQGSGINYTVHAESPCRDLKKRDWVCLRRPCLLTIVFFMPLCQDNQISYLRKVLVILITFYLLFQDDSLIDMLSREKEHI